VANYWSIIMNIEDVQNLVIGRGVAGKIIALPARGVEIEASHSMVGTAVADSICSYLAPACG
jgi:hypothetical protein